MKTEIYKIDQIGIQEMSIPKIFDFEKSKDAIFFIDIQATNRDSIANELEVFGIEGEIAQKLRRPEENIRFEYYDNTLYGELAYYSILKKQPNYAAVLSKDNIVIFIHEYEEGALSGIKQSLSSFGLEHYSERKVEFLFYITIMEILSIYTKEILHHREEIEEIAVDFDKKHTDISPADFLEAKTMLSHFSRVIEKVYYTLSFPPLKSLLEPDNTYRLYFSDLQKRMDLVKYSLVQTEERLNSLNDHYQLMLQSKSNKRLNFLTVIQSVFVPLTLIAGIYGMNFKYMPELEYEYGYFLSLGVMLVIAGGFFWYFFRHKWFE